MRKRHPGTRAWYAGKSAPDEELLSAVEAADPDPQFLYEHTAGEAQGEYAEIVKAIYDKMDTLKRSPNEFRSWTEEDGMETFFQVLLDFSADLRERVQLLQRLGGFRFRTGDGPMEKKAKIEAVFVEPDEDDLQAALRSQAK